MQDGIKDAMDKRKTCNSPTRTFI